MTDARPERQDTGAGFDPGQDQDADPDSLQPREPVRGRDGASDESSASGTGTDEGTDDPDADPEQLNPRDPG